MFFSVWQDVRFGAGRLIKTPMLTVVVAATLGLAIGANSAIFNLLDALYFRPLSIEGPNELARLYTGTAERGRDPVSYPDFADYRSEAESFSAMVASGRRGALLRLGDAPEPLLVEVVSPNYFHALGVAPELGSAWRPDSPAAGDERRVVISHELWQRRFGGGREIVGSSIHLSGRDLVIGAVAPRSFRGLSRGTAVDVWIQFDTWSSQMNSAADFEARGFRWLDVWGRLRPGKSAQEATAECGLVAARLAQAYPATNRDRVAAVVLEVDERRKSGLSLSVLLALPAGLVLLVCCANVANLLLAQAEGRRREMATRSALGASRSRLVSQVLGETLALSVVGGVVGLLPAVWLTGLLPAVMVQAEARMSFEFGVDVRVVIFIFVVTALSAALLGAAPALHAIRRGGMAELHGQAGVGERVSKMSLRNVLVVSQVAACFALLASSGLLIRSLVEASEMRPGFDRKAMLLLRTNPGLGGVGRAESVEFLDELSRRLESAPYAGLVSYAMRVPLSSSGGGASVAVFSASRNIGDQEAGLAVKYNSVGPGYFAAMGSRILQGRRFSDRDRSGSPPVVLISETTARRFWAGAEAVGDSIDVEGVRREIVGVVEDVKINRVDEPAEPYLYLPFAQHPRSDVTVLIETTTEADAAVGAVRATLRGLNSGVPVLGLTSQQEMMRFVLRQEYLYARLATAFGFVGLLLAATGLYGVIAYQVRRRTGEIGVRMTLGARPGQVVWSFVRTGVVLSGVGLAVGLVAAELGSPFLVEFLHGVSPGDPLVLACSAAILVGTAASASFLAARAAARIDPLQALKRG